MKFSSSLRLFAAVILRKSVRSCVCAFAPHHHGWKPRGGTSSVTNFSSQTHRATVPPSPSASWSEDQTEKAVSESMDIVGNSVMPSTFGGVSFWDTSDMNEFRVLFVLGGPGAGKGTQSTFLKEQYPCVHLSVGELLREEQAKDDSPNGALISECLVAGKIVPVEISLGLLQTAMEEAAQESGKELFFLVDGFPRNFDNLDGWNRCMKGISSVWGVLMFCCPLEVLEERILSRAETSGRSDDNLKSAQKRFHTFESQTVPVIETLRKVQNIIQKKSETKMPVSVEDIQGNQSIDKVWADTQDIMNKYLANDVWSANARLIKAIQEGNAETYQRICAFGAPDETMEYYEGKINETTEIRYASIDFISGTRATTSYERTVGGVSVKETRTWSHEGVDGWVNVHFSRTPVLQ